MSEATLGARIEALIQPTLHDLGFVVVRIGVSGGQRPRLQVMAEPVDGRAMTVDDCAEISRAVSAVLDVEDPIHGAYTLEVSSPGIDRPLVRLDDFRRFAGHDARVEMVRPIDGRRRFTGRLLGVDEDNVSIEVAGTPLSLPFVDVQRAKLLLTDRLLAAEQGRKD